MLAVEKLSLTQNIYIILNLAESEELNRKTPFFPRESVKKAAESVREIICMQLFH